MKKLAVTFALALSLTFIAGCHGHGIHFGKGVAGSGNRKTEKRIVAEFKGIDVGGAYDVEIIAQQELSIEIEGDDNLLSLIKTEVKSGTLHIYSDKPFSVKKSIKLKITAPDVQSLDISGASTVHIMNVKNDRLEMDVSGASTIIVKGETQSLKIDSSGASKIDADSLKARAVNVSVSGAGTANVYATEELMANASGASTIIYSGEPKIVSRKDSGASSITKK